MIDWRNMAKIPFYDNSDSDDSYSSNVERDNKIKYYK